MRPISLISASVGSFRYFQKCYGMPVVDKCMVRHMGTDVIHDNDGAACHDIDGEMRCLADADFLLWAARSFAQTCCSYCKTCAN